MIYQRYSDTLSLVLAGAESVAVQLLHYFCFPADCQWRGSILALVIVLVKSWRALIHTQISSTGVRNLGIAPTGATWPVISFRLRVAPDSIHLKAQCSLICILSGVMQPLDPPSGADL